jgi:hypothetical protein
MPSFCLSTSALNSMTSDEERVRLEFRSTLRSGQSSLILDPLALMRRLA